LPIMPCSARPGYFLVRVCWCDGVKDVVLGE